MFGAKGWPDRGLVLHWALNETGGLVAKGRKNSADGTLVSMEGDEWVAGKIGNALSFDGVDEFVDIFAHISLLPQGNSPRTIAFWFRDSTLVKTTFAYGTNLTGQRFEIAATTDRISVSFNGHEWGRTDFINTGFTHVAIVVPLGATRTDEVTLYRNGLIIASQTVAGSPVTLNTGNNLAFIAKSIGAVTFNDGIIDDFRVYDRALSAAEILGLANLGV